MVRHLEIGMIWTTVTPQKSQWKGVSNDQTMSVFFFFWTTADLATELYFDIVKVPHHGSLNNCKLEPEPKGGMLTFRLGSGFLYFFLLVGSGNFFIVFPALAYIFCGDPLSPTESHKNPPVETIKLLLDSLNVTPHPKQYTYEIDGKVETGVHYTSI